MNMNRIAMMMYIVSLAVGCSTTPPPKSADTSNPSGELMHAVGVGSPSVPAPPSVLSTQSSSLRVPPTTLPSGVYNWNDIPMQTTKSGERRQFLRGPTATLDELEMHVTTLNPGQQAHPPHRHPHEEMMFVKEGMLEAVLNDRTIPLPSGSALFVSPNDLHNLKNVGTTQATYFVITWRTPKTAARN